MTMLANMFRMCLNEDAAGQISVTSLGFGSDSDCFSSAEEAAVERMVAMQWPLLMEGDRVNTKSEDGSRACADYLEALDGAAEALRLEKAPRAYRESFTVNYRALFPDEARNYRVDVLEAAFEQYAVIWVNGDKFEFSTEAMRRAEGLQRAWWELGAALERWGSKGPSPQPERAELRGALLALDHAWTSFEHKYIYELIAIEEKARRLLVRAIERERCVHAAEAHGGGIATDRGPEYRESQRRLVACVAHLNSVANVSRKGRDDLSVDVFFDAVSVLKQCDSADSGGDVAENLRAARILATDVVESFEAMRVYLREVEHCLERVDPHLCNNAGLVARLVDWEESWELGARYMQNAGLLAAVCGLVAEVRAAQRVAPRLAVMCEECDVELFLVLPRIMLLCFLSRPVQYEELLRSILPHRFPDGGAEQAAGREAGRDAELDSLVSSFRRVEGLLAAGQPRAGDGSAPGAGEAQQAARELLVRRVVVGDAGAAECFEALAPGSRQGAQRAVDELLRELEPWSIELQRHCPDDWNQCSAVLVQCLTRGGKEQGESPFHV